jgi:pyruvyltransferase
VWGSGINGKSSAYDYDFSDVDIRAVRGPLTREMVINNGGDCPEVFGDPGLLVGRLFPELKQQAMPAPDIDVSLVLNINDLALVPRWQGFTPAVHLISPHMNWRSVAAHILRSKFVVSSSLHGIILAEAFGVACRPMLSLFEPVFKFEDYFLSTGRDGIIHARSVATALELGAIPKPCIDLERLIDVFPMDLFSSVEKSQLRGSRSVNALPR